MQASVFAITGRRKAGDLSVVAPDDFLLEPRGTVEHGIILDRPSISLYCLDDRRREAVFVETPPDIDLTRYPFYYQAQYEHATRVLTISYEALGALADEAADPAGSLILIYSVGRCGSTLLSRAFSRLAGVDSLSEPDFYTQIAGMRVRNGSRDRELTQLIRSCTRLLRRSAILPRGAVALKFRSFVIDIADLFQQAYPGAKALFLYRNAEAWAGSAARAFQVSPLLGTACMWLPVMERYLSLRAAGVPMLAIRYETLTESPVSTLRPILEYCGFAIEQESMALEAFAEDSQAGTSLARTRLQANPFALTSEDRDQLRLLLQQQPRIQNADFVLPGTVM